MNPSVNKEKQFLRVSRNIYAADTTKCLLLSGVNIQNTKIHNYGNLGFKPYLAKKIKFMNLILRKFSFL